MNNITDSVAGAAEAELDIFWSKPHESVIAFQGEDVVFVSPLKSNTRSAAVLSSSHLIKSNFTGVVKSV